MYTIFTLDLFYRTTKKNNYARQLKIAFSWFLGNNYLKQIMCNPVNGACYDGLEKENVNINQGAESSVCYFMARIIAEKYYKMQPNKKAKRPMPVKTLPKMGHINKQNMLIPLPTTTRFDKSAV